MKEQQRTTQSFVLGREEVESLWVRIRGQTSTASFGGGVCYKPPDHEEVDEAFFRYLEEAS